MPLSKLAKSVTTPSPYSEYFKLVNELEANPYSKEHPERAILMSVAECVLNYPLFLENYPKYTQLHHGDNEYSTYQGRVYLLKALSRFLSKYVWHTEISPDNIVTTCGSAAAMELLTCCVCEPGDAVLVISPAYVAFQRDITMRTNTHMYFADTQPNNYKVTKEVLLECYNRAMKDGHKPSMLVYTNPANPMGLVYSKEEMELVYQFACEYDLHIFADEVYACSINPNTKENVYYPFAQFIETKEKQDNITMLWGFSKDMGLSGFRFTTLYTKNQELLNAMKVICLYYEVPSVAQSVIANMLSDDEYLTKHLTSHQQNVCDARDFMKQFFDQHEIPYAPADAAFFLWIDLHKYMKGNTFEDEMELWRYMAYEGGVVVSPGRVFFSEQPGWYRIVYTIHNRETTELALNRMIECLKKRQN